MEKAEIERINTFLNDVQEAICEQDPPHVLQLQLNELFRVIKTLMDETFKAKGQQLKIVLARLEKRAREYMHVLKGQRRSAIESLPDFSKRKANGTE